MNDFKVAYVEFLQFLRKKVPKTKKYTNKLLTLTGEEHFKNFVKCNMPHIDDILAQNVDAFRYGSSGVLLLPGMSFAKFLQQELSEEVVSGIWKHLKNVYSAALKTGKLGRGAIASPVSETADPLAPPVNLDEILENEMSSDEDDDDDDGGIFGGLVENLMGNLDLEGMMGDFAGATGGTSAPSFLEGMEDTTIGKMTKEIADELGIDEGTDISQIDIGELIKKTMSTIAAKHESGELNPDELQQEATQFAANSGMPDPATMMSNLMGGGGNPEGLASMMQAMSGMMGGGAPPTGAPTDDGGIGPEGEFDPAALNAMMSNLMGAGGGNRAMRKAMKRAKKMAKKAGKDK